MPAAYLLGRVLLTDYYDSLAETLGHNHRRLLFITLTAVTVALLMGFAEALIDTISGLLG